MNEAERRYLTEIAADCRGVLGPGTTEFELELDELGDSVRLIARFELNDDLWESVATGETMLEAHARLRGQLVVDRIRFGFTTLVKSR